jgi:anti-sigma factor RsiW
MVNCREIETQLAAYVDGAVGAGVRETVEAHLERCPPCRARATTERSARELLCVRRDDLRGCAPESLRRRCAAQRSAAARTRLFSRRAVVPLSMAATLVVAAALFLTFGWGTSVETYAAQLAVDHVKCFQFPPDSGMADAAALGSRWQASNGWPLKIAASAPGESLELLGVKRCGSTKGRVAHILYKWQGHPLSVYVLNGTFEGVPQGGHGPHAHETVHRFGEEAIVWADRGRTYAVVAQRRVPDLQQVAAYVRRAIE